MSASFEDLTAALHTVHVEIFTPGHVVGGTITTRFTRVADILNQLTSTHLPVRDGIVREYGASTEWRSSSTIVNVDEILAMLAPELTDASSGDLRVPKAPVRANLALPPLWLSGTVYVPVGSHPADGLLNLVDRFVPMTDVSVTSSTHRSLRRQSAVAAVRRDRAHVIQFEERRAAADRPREG